MEQLIRNEFTNTIVVEKSIFITYLKYCPTEEDAKAHIAAVCEKHPDATHVCYAYYINDMIQKASDDNEPRGSAGLPMLEAIKKTHTKHICACVVRYFKGIKLGVKGLIRTYSNAVSTAIHLAPKMTLEHYLCYAIQFDYSYTNKIEHTLKTYTITNRSYDLKVTITFLTKTNEIIQTLNDITNGDITVTEKEGQMIEVPLP